MNKKSLDISSKIDSLSPEIYECVDSVASLQNIPFFVIGATARDMIMQLGYNIEVPRATVDIDLAFQVPSWQAFEKLKGSLITSGPFTKTKTTHRLLFQNRIPIDIVPFGSIEQSDSTINWPPEYDIKMSILGFEDAYEDAILVRVKNAPKVEVLVASLSSLAALKLIAWEDRVTGREKDAHDLRFMIRHYLDCDNAERLHSKHTDLVGDDFDYDLAGARLLGRDLAALLGQEARKAVQSLLLKQTEGDRDRYLLVEDMSLGDAEKSFQENLKLLKALLHGMRDNTKEQGR